MPDDKQERAAGIPVAGGKPACALGSGLTSAFGGCCELRQGMGNLLQSSCWVWVSEKLEFCSLDSGWAPTLFQAPCWALG